MPHAVIKLTPGRSEAQKQAMADAVSAAIADKLGIGEHLVSVGVEEVTAEDWKPTVYEPEITAKLDAIYKKPGY